MKQETIILQCRFCGATCDDALTEMPCQNCRVDVMFRFVPPGTARNYAEIKKELGLTDEDIATIFGYKNLNAFSSSTAAVRIKKAVERIYYTIIFKQNGIV